MKIAFVKHGSSLTPAYNRDRDNFTKLKDDTYEFEIKRNRNLLHHRKFWAILTMVCANSDKWKTPEALLIALKIKLGYFNIIPGFDGIEIIHAGSIRFEAMDQDKFSKFYDAALPLCASELGVAVELIEQNMGEYL
jgi:hypothetical protein